jgi:hypothetical protein
MPEQASVTGTTMIPEDVACVWNYSSDAHWRTRHGGENLDAPDLIHYMSHRQRQAVFLDFQMLLSDCVAKIELLKLIHLSTREPSLRLWSNLPQSPLMRSTSIRTQTTPKAIADLKASKALPEAFECLNNLIEQDHRFIKRLTKPEMGFSTFETAWQTLQRFEIMNMIRINR